jgi:phage-related protein
VANFDAGAVEAKLTLDRTSFTKDLKEAKAQAKEFEKNKIKIGVDLGSITAELEKLKAQVEKAGGNVNVGAKVSGEEAIKRLKAQLATIGNESVRINVDADATGEITKLRAQLKAIPDEKVTVEVDTDSGVSALRRLAGEKNSIRGVTLAVGALIAILPAIVPLATAAAAALGGLVAIAGTLGVGIGAFALVAIPAWQAYTKAVKNAKGDLSKLNPQMRALRETQLKFNAAVQGFGANRVYAVFQSAIELATAVLKRIKPIVDAVSIAFSGLLHQMKAFVESPAFTGMVSFISKNFGPTFKLLTDIVGNLIMTLGGITKAFLPFGQDMLSGLKDITAGWAAWAASLGSSKKFKDFMAYVKENGPKIGEVFMSIGRALGNIGAALAPLGGGVLDAVSGFFNAIGKMNTSVLGALIVGIGALTVGIIAATAAMAAFDAVAALNPFVLIALAIIALVAAFIYLWKTNEGFRNFFISTWNAIWGFMKAVGAWFAGPFAGFFVSGFNAVKGAVQAVWGFMVAAWNAIKGAVSTAVHAISAVVMAIFNGIKGFVMGWVNTVKAIWRAFWGVFGGVVTAYINLIKAIFQLGFAVMRLIVNTVMNSIKQTIITVWNAIKSQVSAAVNTVKSVITTVWNAIKSVTSSVWNAIKSVVSSAVNALRGPVSSAVNAVKSVLSNAWNAVKSVTSSVWNALSGVVGNALSSVLGKVESIVGSIKGVFSGAASWLYSAGVDIIQGLLSGIESMIGSVTAKLKHLTSLIPKSKGPEDVDKKLLRPNARWIMGGFIDEISKQIPNVEDVLKGLTGTMGDAKIQPMSARLAPIAAGVASSPGVTKAEFMEVMADLIAEIRTNTQPLIGNYNDAHKDPREIAEEWWFVTKGR